MTDRELIEAAAKAAGIAYEFHHGCGDSLHLTDPASPAIYWNPLVNDGQALRLAVTLGLVVDCGRPSAGQPFYSHEFAEIGNADPAASTRRAITRAAAALAGTAHGEGGAS